MNAKQKTVILASSHFLSTPLPDDYIDMSESEINVFIRKNAWEPFENYDPDYIWEHIENLSDDMMRLLNEGI